MAEGESVRLTVDTNRLHVFDTDGNAIPHAAGTSQETPAPLPPTVLAAFVPK